jgi:hypothetical protein
MSTALPDSVATGAHLLGSEYGWSIAAFPAAIRKAYACLGGQFQFRVEGSIREMYWHCAESTDRRRDESWAAFANRSCQEVRAQFEKLVREVDFEAEAATWRGMKDGLGPGERSTDYLVFVAYFVSEFEHQQLKAVANGA